MSNVIGDFKNPVVNANPSEPIISNVEPLFNQLLSKLKTNIETITDGTEKDNKIKEYLSELDKIKSELTSYQGYFDWFSRTGGKTNKNKKRKNKTKKMKKRK